MFHSGSVVAATIRARCSMSCPGIAASTASFPRVILEEQWDSYAWLPCQVEIEPSVKARRLANPPHRREPFTFETVHIWAVYLSTRLGPLHWQDTGVAYDVCGVARKV